MCALKKLHPLPYRGQKAAWIPDIQWNGYGKEGNAVPQAVRAVAAAHIDGDHDSQKPLLDGVPVQFGVAPDRRRHQGEDDVIVSRAAGVAHGLDLLYRDLGPGEFLRSAAGL